MFARKMISRKVRGATLKNVQCGSTANGVCICMWLVRRRNHSISNLCFLSGRRLIKTRHVCVFSKHAHAQRQKRGHACILGPRQRFVTEGKKKKITKGIFNLGHSLWEAQVIMQIRDENKTPKHRNSLTLVCSSRLQELQIRQRKHWLPSTSFCALSLLYVTVL